MGWTLAILLLAGILLVGLWQWAVATRAIWMLDAVDGWFTGSKATLAAGPVAYGDEAQQQLYVWKPANGPSGTARPVLVFIHGGGWTDGSPKDYGFVARNFAAEGYVAVNLGYRLGDAGKFPNMLEDSAKGLRWVHDHIAEYGGNPDRIYLMGHSAGAYNAQMLALDRQWLGREGLHDDTLKGVIGLAGPYDFYPFDNDSSRAAFGEAPDPAKTQPVNFARGDAPPMLLATGSLDQTVRPRNSASLAARMRDKGITVEPLVIDGMDHVGIILTMARPFDRDGRAKHAALAFLRAREAELDAAPKAAAETAPAPTASVPVQAAGQ
ncbi:MAG: alpha/beta hydrolase [Sphingomonadales bacterium]|nr:alpha/beta hydrolase [Sphingomonadales bacterium]MBD3774287.1 alpha/beta hydrolase [Paracoccaceae bacterium]